MKDSIYGLSLSTLVRQMMCGIVFFIPIVLWKNDSDWGSLIGWLRSWNATGLIAFGVVAACIGTIIYHIEKNLWAYSWQWVRLACRRRDLKKKAEEKKSGKNGLAVKKIPLIIAVVFMLGPLIALFCTSLRCALRILLVILSLMFPIALFTGESKVLVKNTQKMWRASSKLPDDFAASLEKKGVSAEKIIELYEVKEIARREAGWADYIHCGQTSAFAWILGCLLVWWSAGSWPGDFLKWYEPSLWGAIWLLGFEMLCEVHKQMHINKLLDAYEELKTEIEKKKDDHSDSSQQGQ